MKDNFYFKASLVLSFILFAFALRHAAETGIYNGLVLLAFSPLIVWLFGASIRDYVRYARAERRKEHGNYDR